MGPELIKKERTACESDLIAEFEEEPENCQYCSGTGVCEKSYCPRCFGECVPLWDL